MVDHKILLDKIEVVGIGGGGGVGLTSDVVRINCKTLFNFYK